MAEGFEPYHVPQQSRRDKLRVVDNNLQGGCAPLAPPLYDPSLDFISANLRHHSYNHLHPNSTNNVKQEGMNLMNFVSGMNMFVDPHMSVHINPSSIPHISTNPYLYASSPHCYNNNSGQSLSLSLSSHHTNNPPLELNLQGFDDSSVFGDNNNNNSNNNIELSKSSVPLGPFTGYASVLKGSRFLKPAQQLLEELCDVGRGIYSDKNGPDSGLLDPTPSDVDDSANCGDHGSSSDQTRKKSRLLSMLDEVYKRYKQYYQQMQAAVAAFESVAGLSSAAPFANLALKAMSKHFRCLKNAITDQLHFTSSKSHGKISSSERDETLRPENSGRATYAQRPFHSGFVDQPVWRPQRGLPERAVTVLRAWLFDHFLHPYPTDTDKLMLAKQTGLSRNQVSNWFINARVRLWKPMVEEIHMLETRQGQKASSQRDEQHPNTINNNNNVPSSCSIECENASTSVQRTGEFPLKRTREDAAEPQGGSVGHMKLSYDNLLHNTHYGMSNTGGGGGGRNSGVSLTLGLHQNGVGLSDSYPINAARRFGLDMHGEQGYVVSGFAAQNRQFGRGIIEGQIMHDFVG
ncbi:hypothetical protein ACS0TY_015886 [Phlomoides rotata]